MADTTREVIDPNGLRVVYHDSPPPKSDKALHVYSVGADRAAMAIPPTPEQIDLERQLEQARADLQKVRRQVIEAERERQAREMGVTPEAIDTLILRGSALAPVEEVEHRIDSVNAKIAVLAQQRDQKMRAWRAKHGA